jgi:hypothetical protein
MRLLKMLSKPAAWASGGTSAILCFSAATGYWLAGERRRAIIWAVLGRWKWELLFRRTDHVCVRCPE